MEKLEFSHIAVGNQNGTATLENSSVVSQIIKHTFATWHSNSIPRGLPRRMKAQGHIQAPKGLFIGIIHADGSWGQHRCPSTVRDKQKWNVYLSHETAGSQRKDGLLIHATHGWVPKMCWGKQARSKTPLTAWFYLHEIFHRGKYRDRKWVSGCLGPRVGMQELVEVVEMFQNWVVMVAQLFKFPKIIELYT